MNHHRLIIVILIPFSHCNYCRQYYYWVFHEWKKVNVAILENDEIISEAHNFSHNLQTSSRHISPNFFSASFISSTIFRIYFASLFRFEREPNFRSLSFSSEATSFDRDTNRTNDEGRGREKRKRVSEHGARITNTIVLKATRARHNYCLCFEQFILKWKAICIYKLNARPVSLPNAVLPG